MAGGPRWPGAVGEYRRPRRVHHFLARRIDRVVEPADLVRLVPPRPRRNLAPQRLSAAAATPLLLRRLSLLRLLSLLLGLHLLHHRRSPADDLAHPHLE